MLKFAIPGKSGCIDTRRLPRNGCINSSIKSNLWSFDCIKGWLVVLGLTAL